MLKLHSLSLAQTIYDITLISVHYSFGPLWTIVILLWTKLSKACKDHNYFFLPNFDNKTKHAAIFKFCTDEGGIYYEASTTAVEYGLQEGGQETVEQLITAHYGSHQANSRVIN